MPYSVDEEIEMMIAGVEGDGAQKRIRSLVRAKHTFREQMEAQAAAHAAEKADMEKRLADMEAKGRADIDAARASWQEEAKIDVGLSDLGIASPFDRDTLRRLHSSTEGAAPILDWAGRLKTDEKARAKLPQSVQALFSGQRQGSPPNPDRDTKRGNGGDLTADKIRDMPAEEFARLTGRA